MTPIRVLHCPEIVAGNAQQLARAERDLGLHSVAVALEQTKYAYETDEVLFEPRDGPFRHELKRIALLRRAIRDFDVVHFNFGQTMTAISSGSPPRSPLDAVRAAYVRLVEFRDLPILRRAGKGIVMTYQGDDARQGDYILRQYDVSIAHDVADYYTAAGDVARRRRIRRVDRYANAVFALNPDLLNVLPARARFLPYASVDVKAWKPVPFGTTGRPVVLHAPTDRRAKGTRLILEAADRLHADGVDFEFVLVEGLTHEKARREYERADLVVDQVLAGWYGGLAVELMALGKPVVAYIRPADLDRIPVEMRNELPVIDAEPSTITDVLRRLLTTDRALLPEFGARSRAYVERWHDPLKIAAQTKATYERILGR
jgi:glycosyltransferase involved in cell wall biosynthesis